METGNTVTVTEKGGATYTAFVRGVHETGFTLWMDGEAKDEGEVRTVHTSGPDAVTVVKEEA